MLPESVAVVGTGEPSDGARARARRLVKNLVEEGEDDFTVVFGLAQGIDTEAHTTATEFGEMDHRRDWNSAQLAVSEAK